MGKYNGSNCKGRQGENTEVEHEKEEENREVGKSMVSALAKRVRGKGRAEKAKVWEQRKEGEGGMAKVEGGARWQIQETQVCFGLC